MNNSRSDESFLDDEDSSYKKLVQHNEIDSEDESVIDESESDHGGIDSSSSDLEASAISDARKHRYSEVVSTKKKPLRRIASETESENEDNLTTDHLANRSGNQHSETDDELEPVQSPTNSPNRQPIENDTESETDDDLAPVQSPTKSTNQQTLAIDDSDTDDDSESRLVIDSFAEQSDHNNTTTSPGNPDGFLHDVKNTRLSHQFQFNSNDILNSTSVHFTAEPKAKWRPSNVFGDSGGIEEKSANDSSVEVLSDDDTDIIEVSSGELVSSPPKTPFKMPKPKPIARQQTLHSFIQKGSPGQAQQPTQKPVVPKAEPLVTRKHSNGSLKNSQSTKIVSRVEYEAQKSRVNGLENDFVKLQMMAEKLDFEALPDKGQLIKDRLRIAENKFSEENLKLINMEVSDDVEEPSKPAGAFANVAWEDLQAGANTVLPKTFGKQAISTYNAQKAVTMDRLQQLHGALQTCPKEEDMAEDPKGLKVPLMAHQRRALAWLMFREKEKPSGGILADDMGLGKTLTMISLIVKMLEIERKDDDSDEENNDGFIGKHTKFDGGSLIVCPASLINQWSGEIERRLKRGLLSFNVYHGPKRESKAKKLAEYDVVITTYAIVNNENDKKSALFKIKWRRIILDEAHQIRNHRAQTSEACCQLSGKSRWALTGTPMHNKEVDMYALLKFLRCTPFDDLQVWKRWVSGGPERLHTIISSLMLRRTKAELIEKGTLNCMPEKKWVLVNVELDKRELEVYHKVLIFSQTLFAQFLHQRAEKNQDFADAKFCSLPNDAPNEEYFKMRQKILKLNKVKNISQHEILVLLLRLRQICCHPSLITAMLEEGLDVGEGDEECEELNLLDQLQKLNIGDEEKHEDEYNPDGASAQQEDKVNLKEAVRGHLRASDPVFSKERASSKIKYMLKVLKSEVLCKDDKAVIVSQFSSYLTLIAMQLKQLGIQFDQLDGKVPVSKRMEMVNKFNDPTDPMRVLLLSLTAGGVGLNLVGANHLFLLDLHWNPQLENQAQDRIYRVGQQKPVFIYKFLAVDTIEERIKKLQDNKLEMANGILTGTRQVVQNKLSMDDLKMIFGVQ